MFGFMNTSRISLALLVSLWACAPIAASGQELTAFGLITIEPSHVLNGEGSNVDSIAFWETDDPAETLMFVTGKSNDLVEVWRYPFEDNELDPIEFPANVNGVVVDQETDTLYVSDRIVSVIHLPNLEVSEEFGRGDIAAGENNLDILKHADGRTLIYVSDDHNVHRFDADGFVHLDSFAPPVTSIETVLADDFHQLIHVPEEQGPEGSPGVFVYHPDGTPYEQNGTNRYGNDGEFQLDEEGVILYTFPTGGIGDDGTGFIVVSDQRADVNEYEFFDRITWAHLGTLRLQGISNTDGIASIQRPLPDYPLGLFAAIDDDTATAIVGWDVIFKAIGWDVSQTNPHSAMNQRIAIEEIGGERHLTYTFPSLTGVTYSVNGSVDLIRFNQPLAEVLPASSGGLPPLSEGLLYRTFRLIEPIKDQPKGFLRLDVNP